MSVARAPLKDPERFQSQKNFLRDAIREVASYAHSSEEFGKDLYDYYGIRFKVSRGRFSYLHPDRQKYMTGRTLGNDYTESYLLPLFAGNKKAGRTRDQMLADIQQLSDEHAHLAVTDFPVTDTRPEYDPSYDYNADPIAVLHFRTKLRLVVDLQSCAKAQVSRAYARKVKMTNLQQMAQTICYVQEHGYNTKADLEYDRQMNITALNKLRNTLEKITTQISKIESSDNDEQSSNQFDILQQTRIQLLTNQKTLKQNIRNLEIISSNVDNILHFESDHQLSNDRSTQR